MTTEAILTARCVEAATDVRENAASVLTEEERHDVTVEGDGSAP